MVVVAGGGLGLGGVDHVVRALLARNPHLHVAALCGRNAALRASITPLAVDWRTAPGGHASLTVHGFTCEMPTWLAAADLLVGKPGGLTSAEACAAATPMVLLKPIPGQEERNAQHLVAAGAAVASGSPRHAAELVTSLMAQPHRLAAMSAAARATGRPHAAAHAARAVLGTIPPLTGSEPAAPYAPAVCATERELAHLPCVAG